MRRALLATMLGALLLLQASAPAQQPDPVAAMRQLAPVYWADQACPGGYPVTFAPLRDDERLVIYGQAHMLSTDNGVSWQGVCPDGLTFNSRVFPSVTVILRMWPFFCDVFDHEFGHLLGLPDSPDSNSFMFVNPELTTVPQTCLRSPTGRRFHRRSVYRAFP